ncbi:MAG: M14 family zinc carboxypeptidase [Fodinibius sp.]|nr:M14 family zinc carboxypeptidase [Fodinibius sp.]
MNYNSEISSPAEFLGYELGSEFTLHSDVMQYFKYLAANSDRLTLHKYAETYEGREALCHAVYKFGMRIVQQYGRALAHVIICGLQMQTAVGSSAADRIMENQPITVWLSYNVHGNEPSSSESAMQTAYRLVAGMDDETQRMREQAITIIDPMLNPDGRDRYVNWYKSSRSSILNDDSRDLEHDEIWPGGRTNHYWFDLNRDWVWLSTSRIARTN